MAVFGPPPDHSAAPSKDRQNFVQPLGSTSLPISSCLLRHYMTWSEEYGHGSECISVKILLHIQRRESSASCNCKSLTSARTRHRPSQPEIHSSSISDFNVPLQVA